jgi:lipid II:glycine glycyltransferase (peptidoglycan interpeptide bridge formation enzyme)
MIKTQEVSLTRPFEARWIEFTLSHAQANIFHHPAWINLLVKCYDYNAFLVTVEDEHKIHSGVPVIYVNSQLTGRRLISLPFTDHCIPLSESENSLGCLTEKLINLPQSYRNIPLELRWNYPDHPKLTSHSPYVFHTLQLSPKVDDVAIGLHPTHRRNIRIAQENGVRVVLGKDLEQLKEFYKLHLQTRRRQGVPVQPWRFFELIREELFNQGLGFVLLAYKDKNCLAGAVFLHWNKTLTYKFGASDFKSLELRPNNLLFWKAIQWGCENDYKVFDLGRTDLENSGLRRFKKGWGADETQLIYTSLTNKTNGTSKNKLSHMMKTIIQKSPTLVCKMTGKLLYRHFA